MAFSLKLPFFEIAYTPEKRAVGANTPGNLGKWLYDTHISGVSGSGATVNANTAVNLSAVYRAINWLADSLSLPCDVYRIEGNDRNKVSETDQYYPAQYLLRISPNKMHTPSEWMRLMEMSRNLYGNAYTVIIRNGLGYPIAFRWVHPDQVRVYSDGENIAYDVINADGSMWRAGISYWNMIHVKAMSFDGYIGKSPISVARESLGVALSQQKTSSDYYASGMKQKIVLTHPGTLGETGGKNLKESFDQQMQGKGTVVLEEGLKPFPLTIPPADSQFLESRVFSIQEIARWYGVSPNVLMDSSKANYNTLEQQSLWDVRDSVRPRARMYEQEFNTKLLFNDQKVYTSFNINALMRADFKTRFDAYALAIQNRIYNPNEIREMEDKNGYEGGEVYENPNITPGAPGGGQEDGQ